MAQFYPWNSYSEYLEKNYGYRIWRIGVDAGFSCPNRDSQRRGGCVYCDALGATAAYQKTYDGLSLRNTEIKNQIERGKIFLQKRYKAEHFALYLQSFSNTYAPVDELKKIYDYALSCGQWEEFIVSTRPDCIDEQKVKLLSSYKTSCLRVCVELGLQSGSDYILKQMNRGHTVSCFKDACYSVKEKGLQLAVHIIIGFPGETDEHLNQTVEVIKTVKPDFIKIHNLNIAKGTVLYNNYLRGEATAPSCKEYIEKLSYVLRCLNSDIIVERLLCETDKQRLVCPVDFPDKNTFLKKLCSYMNKYGYKQGDLYK